MPASKKTQEYVKNELPYKILMSIYDDSRASLRKLGDDMKISYQTVAATLSDLEKKYDIYYTLELDETKLGFSEGRIITVKFERQPEIKTLKEKLNKEIFIQNAYLTTGDFDLLLYVVGLTHKDFHIWQFNLRKNMSEYKPTFRFSTLDEFFIGFLPMRSDFLRESTVLSPVEKEILSLLNDNSRMRLKDIVKKTKVDQSKVIYVIKKLKQMGIIKRFTALTQNPNKRIIMAYNILITPGKDHEKLSLNFSKELLNENFKEITNDYSIMANTTGAFDGFEMCNFESGEKLAQRGPELVQKLWAQENPKIEKAILVGALVGKWPFHLERYGGPEKYTKKEIERGY